MSTMLILLILPTLLLAFYGNGWAVLTDFIDAVCELEDGAGGTVGAAGGGAAHSRLKEVPGFVWLQKHSGKAGRHRPYPGVPGHGAGHPGAAGADQVVLDGGRVVEVGVSGYLLGKTGFSIVGLVYSPKARDGH